MIIVKLHIMMVMDYFITNSRILPKFIKNWHNKKLIKYLDEMN